MLSLELESGDVVSYEIDNVKIEMEYYEIEKNGKKMFKLPKKLIITAKKEYKPL